MSSMEADPQSGASLAGQPAARRQLHPVRVWGLAVTAGLLAGFASWLIGETYHGRFDPAPPTATDLWFLLSR